MSVNISRQSAQKLRLGFQVAGGSLLIGLVAVAAMVPGGVPQPKTTTEDGPILPAVNTNETNESGFRFDEQGVADRLSMLDNAPRADRPAVKDPVAETPTTTTMPADPKGLSERIKFLGTMTVGAKRMALISVDNRRQRVVGEGNALPMPADEPGVTLQQASESEIVVTDGYGASLRIGLKAAAEEQPRFSSMAVPGTVSDGAMRSTVSGGIPGRFDRGGDAAARGRSNPVDVAGSNDGPSFSEAIERRRAALQAAVEKGTLTQERADEMMQRAIQNQAQDSRTGGRGGPERRD